MSKTESKHSLTFRHWVMANAQDLISCSFEIKQTPGDSIPFSCLEDHQIDFSSAIKWGKKGALIRVEAGTVGAPDYVFYRHAPAFVVVFYGNVGFVIIDIDTWILEKEKSKRKSLTWTRAQEIAWRVVTLPFVSSKR